MRYPHYHDGRIVFSYLATSGPDENGQNVQRLTGIARAVYGRFSPEGIGSLSPANEIGNLDVFIIPSEGGARSS